jgi:NADH-quinone oxidoreductase subunit C
MDSRLEKIANVLQQQAGGTIEEFSGEVRITVPAEKIVDTLLFLRDEHEFSLLSLLTVIDYWPQDRPRYIVVYGLTSLTQNLLLQVRVGLDAESPTLPSVTSVFETANWRERELYDMFGIQIEGHPDLRRILMPEDWDGHPLRRDYPLGYEEPQFTFNYKEIDLRKPYVKE